MATMTEASEKLGLNEGMGAGLKLQLSRVIRARRERVWAAWTQPEMLKTWFSPSNMRATRAHCDLKVGGEYLIEVTGPAEDGTPLRVATASGRYLEIVENELLRFSWVGCWRPEEESQVTVALRDVEGGTEVTITHDHVAAAEALGGFERGWTDCLASLGSVLGQ